MIRPPSAFAERLDALVERWLGVVPDSLHQSFRDEFHALGDEHDRALGVIEGIWRRQEHEYAFDERGLARRRPFLHHLAGLIHAPRPSLQAIGVLFIDLDRLKQINDARGHDAGDAALAATGAIIREAVRITRHIDVVAGADGEDGAELAVSRFGGDEFLVAIELERAHYLTRIARRIKQHVDDERMQQRHGYEGPPRLTASVGGVIYEIPVAQPPNRPAHELARRLVSLADEQMYKSKGDGRVHIAVARCPDATEDVGATKSLRVSAG